MPLRGTVQSFPPSEILQFLTHSQKTGILRVHDDTDTKLLAFRGGRLCYAVHQRRMPPLRDIILFRGWAPADQLGGSAEDQQRRDDAVTRALARRRDLARRRPDAERRKERVLESPRDARLGHVLVAQGRLTAEQLESATAPEAIPDALLEAVLETAKLVERGELQRMREAAADDRSLLECALDQGRVSRDSVVEALSRIGDESLAEVLVFNGVLSRAEARHWLGQLETLRVGMLRPIRLGEYLVAKGQIAQGHLERALWEQLLRSQRVGEMLVDQGTLSAEDLARALEEIEILRADFGPLHALRERLRTRLAVEPGALAVALMEHETTRRPLADGLVGSGQVDADAMRAAIEAVLTDELADLLLWQTASFEFLEGFSLEDAISHRDLPVVHEASFEVPRLLLGAHAILDELRRSDFAALSPSTVLVPTSPDEVTLDSQSEAGLLRMLAGHRPLREVCRVLPGNRLAHYRMLAVLLQQDRVRLLTRAEAFVLGKEALQHRRPAEAVALFEHALDSPGDSPPSSRLRVVLRDAMYSSEQRPLRRGVLAVQSTARHLGQTRTWSALRRCGLSVRRALTRLRLVGGELLIRAGIARRLFAVRAAAGGWLDRVPGLRALSPAHALASLGVIAVVTAVFVTGGAPDVAPPVYPPVHAADAPPSFRTSMSYFQAEAPVEVPPALHEDRVFFAARDGTLRAVRAPAAAAGGAGEAGAADGSSGGTLELLWETEVGAFGDILSRPVAGGGALFVTNVRGLVLALSGDGELLWKRELPRLEPLRPALLAGADGEVAGVAVASRESVLVLSPTDGRTLYRLQTGNRVLTAPVGDADSLFVGSGDNHVYGAAWRRGELVWEHEENDDITALVLDGDNLVFTTRDGSLGALDPETGQQTWKRSFSRGELRRLGSVAPGRLYVETEGSRIELVEARGGITLSVVQPDPRLEVSLIRFEGGRGFFISREGMLGELDQDGSLRWRGEVSIGDVTGWTRGDGFLVVTNRQGNVVFVPLAGAP